MGGEATYICRGRYSRQSARSKKRSSGVGPYTKQATKSGRIISQFFACFSSLRTLPPIYLLQGKESQHLGCSRYKEKISRTTALPASQRQTAAQLTLSNFSRGDTPTHGPHSNSQETRKTVNDRLMARPVINPAPVLQIPHLLGNLLCSRCRENLRPGQSVGLEFISR